ncbi:MAG: ATP-binding protein, partial [Bacteroidota bacterium]
MGYRSFRTGLIFRIAGLVASIALALYCAFVLQSAIRSVFSIFLVGLLSVDFYLFLNRVYADLTSFLNALLHDDFTVYRSHFGEGKQVAGMYDLFNRLSSKFHKIRSEKEVQHLFLETLVEQVDIGIICYETDGTIFLVNRAFRELTRTASMQTIAKLEERDPEIVSAFNALRSGEHRLLKFQSHGEFLQLSVICSEFKLLNISYKLITLQNIAKELDEKEIESWQKLIRVLTHEIMNSVTPISSLTESLYERVKSENCAGQKMTPVTAEFLTGGLEAVITRSKGLLRFTQAFHTLLRIPKPVPERVEIRKLFEQVHLLFRPVLEERGIVMSIHTGRDSGWIHVDVTLMEQAIINLVKNALESFSQTALPEISLEAASLPNGRTQITVADNGMGIPPDILDKVFIPFYTTKEKGTGIGLSISRQIAQLHKGTLTVHSIPFHETRF